MKISGFLKTSWIDYPETLACVVYTSKCHFKCGFCHNGDLVKDALDSVEVDLVFKHLEQRRHILDGLVVSGGEPTLQSQLKPFLEKVKTFGLKIKLDTNGHEPEVLKDLIASNLVDYVAMDLKNSQQKYAMTTDSLVDHKKLQQSVAYLKAGKVDYEFRTTLMKDFHTSEDVQAIGEMARGAKRLVFQQYQYSHKQICDQNYGFYTLGEMEGFKTLIEKHYDIEEILIKGKY